MEDIILCGAGAGLANAAEFIAKAGGFHINEIWDNSPGKQGTEVTVNDLTFVVTKPHIVKDIPIVITAVDYHTEIKNGLESMGIPSNMIMKRNYLFHVFKDEILRKYKDTDDAELKDALKWIDREGLEVYNGEWTMRSPAKPECFRDAETGLYYVLWNGKKMYLKREYDTPAKVQDYVCSLIMEQSQDSPHCYFQDGVIVEQTDTVLDAGAAEGFFALDCVDTARKIIIVEMEEDWLEALEMTFKPYMDKVQFVRKLLGDHDGTDEITLNTICNDHAVTYIKMDIEGYETATLKAASEETLHNVRCIKACAYHKSGDGEYIRDILETKGFSTSYSKGYMFFAFEDSVKPELRHGLVTGLRAD